MSDRPAPKVSIVMSTYQRGYLLRYAVQTVLDQTMTDWELIIVDDASPDDTPQIVQEFTDPRIRYFRREQNFGEQSGPNNFGVEQARAPWIAFLNNDDLWFPNHLEVGLQRAIHMQADGVLAGNVAPQPRADKEVSLEGTAVDLRGVGLDHDWRPEVYTPASSWLIRKSSHEQVGGWRPADQCSFESSQDFLFRAYRAGAHFVLSQRVTVLIVQSSNRPDSYRKQSSPEHDYYFQAMQEDPDFRAKLLERAAYLQANIVFRTRFASSTREILAAIISPVAYRTLPRFGIHPRALKFWWNFRGRNGFIRHLKETRGNPETLTTGKNQ